MTISLTGTDVLDEAAGVQSDDSDLSFASFQSALSGPLFSYLFTSSGLNLPTNGGAAAFPQVAWQTGLISLSTPVDDLALTSDGSGAPFPAAGVPSGWTTTTGAAITLYGADGGNVVLGKTPDGTVVFAIVLDETSSGGAVTAANLYMVLFQSIAHGSTTAIDEADTVSLAGLVYLSSNQTTITLFSDFSAAPSGQDVWVAIQPTGGGPTDPDILVTGLNAADTVNVSTTGLGANSQALDSNEALRIDFVNGAPTSLTSALVHNAANISYGSHQEGTGAGFSPVQTNPSKTTVSATVHAYDTTADDQGAAFKTGAAAHQTSVNIASVRVYNGAALLFDSAVNSGTVNGISVDLTGDQAVINGLKSNYRVDFSTDGQMDRFTVQNTTSATNRSFDVGSIYLVNQATNLDHAEIGSRLVVEDSGPSITAAGTIPTLTADETFLLTNPSASFAGVFSPSGGTDGLASTAYTLGVVAGASGLTDTATGQSVVLGMNGTVVEGRTVTSHDLVFTVSVSGLGVVTLDQQRAIVQPVQGNTAAAYDDSVTLTAANLVTLTAKATDGDGDTASAVANIGQALVFKDDGPSITGAGTIPALTADESFLLTNPSASFAGVFTPSGGADGIASTAYTLGVVAGASGLTDTATGQGVVLSLNGAVVEGRTAASHDLVFTVSVDGSGNVTLDQLRALVQPVHGATAAAYDDSVTLTAANLVTLTATVTDGDHDTAAATVNVGQSLIFKDDGPSIATPAGGPVTYLNGQSLHEVLTDSSGADGSVVTIGSYSTPTGLTATLSPDGQHLAYSNGSGPLFTLDVSNAGYTFNVLQDHPPTFIPLDFSGIPSGSPQETLTVPAVGTNAHVTFDGIDFTGTAAIGPTLSSYVNPGAASTVDDLNPNSLGFGEKGGQASQMNQNEGFFASAGAQQLEGLAFDIQGVGSVSSVHVEWWTVGGSGPTHGNDLVQLTGGNSVTHEVITSANAFDQVYVRFYFDANASNAGVRVENFATEIPNVTAPISLDFTLTNTDGDLDTATTDPFHIWMV